MKACLALIMPAMSSTRTPDGASCGRSARLSRDCEVVRPPAAAKEVGYVGVVADSPGKPIPEAGATRAHGLSRHPARRRELHVPTRHADQEAVPSQCWPVPFGAGNV